MTPTPINDRSSVKGLKVFLLTDKGWFEVELKNEIKKTIWRLIDKEKIKLLKP